MIIRRRSEDGRGLRDEEERSVEGEKLVDLQVLRVDGELRDVLLRELGKGVGEVQCVGGRPTT